MQTVVTSFSPAGYELYGRRFITSFEQYFPRTMRLVVYVEEPTVFDSDRIEARSLLALPEFQKFYDRHQGSALASGREPGPTWKEKDRADGYCYRFDALKFCRKVFAISHAATGQDGLLFWMDADSYAHAPIPEAFFPDLLGDSDVAYLGRDSTHSECGFLAFRLPAALQLIIRWENFYRRGTCFQQREWHDSFLFDRAREASPQLNLKNLTPGGRRHVWLDSPLAAYTDHLKGERKNAGFSPERRSMA